MKHQLIVEIPDGDYDIDPDKWDSARLFHYLDAGHAEIVNHEVIFTEDEREVVMAAVRGVRRG